MRVRFRTVFSLALSTCALTIVTFAQNMMVRGYSTPVGGAINRGDFNDDGIPDVVFCSTGVAVALGNADGSLRAPIYSGTDSCQTLAVADFNHDGKLDVVTGSLGAPTTDIYLGNGDGTFRLAQQLAISANDVITADFNNDGNADVALVTSSQLFIYPGLGNGTFGTAVPVPINVSPAYTLRVGDFDADGKADLAVSGIAVNSQIVEVLFNNGNYNFTNLTVATNGFYLLNTGDINQDGFTDLLIGQSTSCVSNPKNETCNWYFQTFLSNGKARTFRKTFTETVGTGTTYGVGDASVADVNGDGINDLVAILRDPAGLYSLGYWKGHADGTFDTAGTYFEMGGDASTERMVPVDLNRDGMPDFALINAGDFRIGLTTMINAIRRAGCSTYTASNVPTGCQPTSGTYRPTSVHFVANAHDSAHPVTSFELFLDNKLSFSTTSLHMDLYRTLPIGNHRALFKEIDSSGASFVSPHPFTVYSGTAGAVCRAALNTAVFCAPTASTVSSPVRVFAAGYPPNTPTSVILYIDNVIKYHVTPLGNFMNATFSLPAGSHHLVFKVYDANGHVVTASKTITVQ